MVNCSIPFIELNTNDISKLKHKVIGQGKEAIVYKGKEGLYKIYRNPSLYSVTSIVKAVNRQPNVKNTTLPIGAIYINESFAGCILKQHRGYIDVHNITGFPRKIKLIVLKKLINDVKELCDNYIYHIDLANKKIDKRTHSNVLVAPNNSIEIIDIDGKSTYYADGYNKQYNDYCYSSLTTLISEILFQIELPDNGCRADDDYLDYQLSTIGLNEDFRKMIISSEATYDELRELLIYVEKNKVRSLSN